MKMIMLTTLLLSTSAFAMQIPEIKGRIQNFTNIPSENLKVVATMSCQAVYEACGEAITSEAKVDKDGRFHLKAKNEQGWDFGRRSIAYQIMVGDQVISQMKNMSSETTFIKQTSVIGLHTTPEINAQLRLATGKKQTLTK